MDHVERISLAKSVSDKFFENHGKDVILSGIYGSTARGEDVEWSDLDILFIVNNDCKIEERSFLYKGTVVGLRILKMEDLETILTTPTVDWPFWMGTLQILKVIHGNRKMVDDWIKKGLFVSDEKFQSLLEKVLPSLVFEPYNKILSCRIRNNASDLNLSITKMILEMSEALCLLNRRWFTHSHYKRIIDTFEFPNLPRRYKELVPKLWNCNDLDEASTLSQKLVDDYKSLLVKEKIQLRDYKRLDDVVI